MLKKDRTNLSAHVLIIGGGGAGLRAAIEARESGADVLLVSKTKTGFANNTYISKGAFAATGLGTTEDVAGVHLQDTLQGGRFINDLPLVEKMAGEASQQVHFLEKCGVNFVQKDESIRLNLAPGHSHPRHVSTVEGFGRPFTLCMLDYAKKLGVRFLDNVLITDIISDGGKACGALGLNYDGEIIIINAPATILATGGFAHIYRRTNNAPGITGDGLYLAYTAGVPLKDMEFVQFYPTALGEEGRRMLLYEAIVARAGAILKNSKEENVIEKHGLTDRMKLTRDRLSQAITAEITSGLDVNGGIILDLTPLPEDMFKRLIPLLPSSAAEGKKEYIVGPTTHFCMGGVIINDKTETSLPGLLAAGEVCGGAHGANRLGGNALTEVFAMGAVAGKTAAAIASEPSPQELPEKAELAIQNLNQRFNSAFESTGPEIKDVSNQLKDTMWNRASVVRTSAGLNLGLQELMNVKDMLEKARCTGPRQFIKLLELDRMAVISEMVLKAALMRTESRGSHFREDFPDEDNQGWLKNTIIKIDADQMKLKSIDVPEENKKFV